MCYWNTDITMNSRGIILSRGLILGLLLRMLMALWQRLLFNSLYIFLYRIPEPATRTMYCVSKKSTNLLLNMSVTNQPRSVNRWPSYSKLNLARFIGTQFRLDDYWIFGSWYRNMKMIVWKISNIPRTLAAASANRKTNNTLYIILQLGRGSCFRPGT